MAKLKTGKTGTHSSVFVPCSVFPAQSVECKDEKVCLFKFVDDFDQDIQSS